MANNLMTGKRLSDRTITAEIKTNDDGILLTSGLGAVAVDNGNLHFGSDIVLAVADGGVVNWLVITGTEQPLFSFAISAVGDYELDLYEDTTVSANGSVYTNFNYNRASANTIQTLVYLTPTISGDGTLIAEALINGGEKNSAVSTDSEGNLLLKTSSNYLIRYTNKSGVTVNVNPSWNIIES